MGGSEFILGKVSLLWGWSNTETGFLSRWLMPHIRQCSGGIWIMLSLICFNFWWALKCPNSGTQWFWKAFSILIIVVISKNKIAKEKRDIFFFISLKALCYMNHSIGYLIFLENKAWRILTTSVPTLDESCPPVCLWIGHLNLKELLICFLRSKSE